MPEDSSQKPDPAPDGQAAPATRPSPSPTKPARPIGRFRIGLLSLIQVLAVLVIFVTLNFISSRHYRRQDLSVGLTYTLSEATQRYLASEAVAGREDPIEMIVAFPASTPYYDRVRPIAEEYARLSGGKIRLRLLDPVRAPDFTETVAAEYKVVFDQPRVIIDARSREDRKPSEGIEISPHVHVIGLKDMLVYEMDSSNRRRVSGFLGEDALTSGLVNAVEGKPKKVYVLADKSDLNTETREGAWKVLTANFVAQNVLPERVRISDIPRIPDDVDALAVIAPRYDFTAQEMKVLEEYWFRPKAALLVTTGDKPVPPRFRAFLRSHGVTPRNDRVVRTEGGVAQTAIPAHFTAGLEFTRDLWEGSTVLEGHTRSLEVREGADDLLNQRIAPYPLLKSFEGFWGDTRGLEDPVEFDPKEDHEGPLALAAAVVRGNATDDRFAGETSRMIVISNTDFLDPKHVREANLDLFSSSLNWLVGREELSGIGPRSIVRYKLPLLPAHASLINRINLVFLPLAALLIGLMVWSSRRS